MCLFKQQNNEMYVSQEECAVSFFSISEEGLVLCYPHFFGLNLIINQLEK